jgi:hypothetical protein
VFNIAYIISLGSPVKNAFLGQVVNGWQVSGITQFQSGPNLQAVGSANFNLGPGNNLTPFVTPNGTIPAGVPLNASLITGSPDYTVQPILTCDPRKGLASGQYINGSCFAAPTIGHNGAFIFPYIHGPAFYNNDLSLFKDFRISEQKKIQFRISGYNFLNHPLPSFENADPHLNIGNPQFGYTSTYVGHRIMQLAFKFYF